MQISQAVLLGFVQGVTEFLPVSSSGHQVLATYILGFSAQGAVVSLLLHTATTCAVLYFFRQQLRALSFEFVLKVFVGILPTICIGFLSKSIIESLFFMPRLVATGFVVSAVLNMALFYLLRKKRLAASSVERMSYTQAFMIGCAQSIALVPGISRSATTIVAALTVGLSPASALVYSFVISIPLVLGASTYELLSTGGSGLEIAFVPAFLAALGVGVLSLRALRVGLSKPRLFIGFSFYCLVAAALLFFS